MGKFLKQGKAVILLQGRYAGKKAVILKNFDEGTKERPYGHCVVVGVERTPLRVTKSMGQKRIAKRSKVKPFIRVVNYNHIMPTRYSVDIDLKELVTVDIAKDPAKRLEARKAVRKVFEEK
jgi:large subunit ribosomal protein L27e